MKIDIYLKAYNVFDPNLITFSLTLPLTFDTRLPPPIDVCTPFIFVAWVKDDDEVPTKFPFLIGLIFLISAAVIIGIEKLG